MGRFYKTAGANPLSYMYEFDKPLMEKALMAQDTGITNTNLDAARLGQLANYEHLEQDSTDAQRVLQGYTSKIDQIAEAIKRDPANWRKQQDTISGVRKDLSKDYQFGEIGRHIQNYKKRAADFAAIDEQVKLYNKTGGVDKNGNGIGISPEDAVLYKRKWDSEFQGTKYNAKGVGDFNPYTGGTAMNHMDIQKTLGSELDKMVADKTLEVRKDIYGKSAYFLRTEEGREELTPDRLLGVINNRFMGNQQLQKYIRERSGVGALRGMVYDQDVKDLAGNTVHRAGELIAPYNVNHVAATPDELAKIKDIEDDIAKTKNPATKKMLQASLDAYNTGIKNRTQLDWNDESALAPIYKGLIGEHAYSKTVDKKELSANPVAVASMNIAARANEGALNRKAANDRADANNKLKEKMAQDQRDFQEKENEKNRAAKGAGKPASGTGKPGAPKLEDTPNETTTSRVSTPSYNGRMTKSVMGSDVPRFSVAGVQGDIYNLSNELKASKAELERHNAILNNPNATQAQKSISTTKKQELEQSIKEGTANYNSTIELRDNLENAVLSNVEGVGTPLSQNEIGIYKKFKSSGDITGSVHRNELQKKREELNTTQDIYRGVWAKPKTEAEKEAAKVKSAQLVQEIETREKELKDFKAANGRIVENQQNLLTRISTQNVIDSDAIVPNKKDSDDIWRTISSNPTGIPIYNEEGKVVTSKVGDNNFTLTGENNLLDYINLHPTQVQVTKLGNTTKLPANINTGQKYGAVVEIRFKGSGEDNKIPDKPYYMVLTPDVQRDLGNKFANSKSAAVKEIASSFTDDIGNEIRTQFTQAHTNEYLGKSGEDEDFKVFLPDATGDNKTTYTVSRTPSGKYLVRGMTANGEKPFPFAPGLPNSGIAGTFANVDDFIRNYKAIKQAAQK